MIAKSICGLICLQFLYIVRALGEKYAPLQAHTNADKDATIAIRRALHEARGTTYSMNQTLLTKSWANATIFSIGASTETSAGSKNGTVSLQSGLEIVCKACYINGTVGGYLTVEDGFNVTTVVDSAEADIANVTDSALSQLEDFAREAARDILEDVSQFQLIDIPAWPTLDLNFDLDEANRFPGVHAQVEFDSLELYLDLDLQLSAGATYTLDLFTSETPAGISISSLEAGAIFQVSLVLIAQAEIDISSGIHIKLEDGLTLALELFNNNVSSITVPGGRMEFLPVTVQGHGTLRALLQVQTSIGFQISTPNSISVFEYLSFSAGIGGEVSAYVADFLLQIDASTSNDAHCGFEAVAEYTLAVGAAAGATVAVDTYQWGPTPNTTVPVFYTTLDSFCAGYKKSPATITPSATLGQRNDLVTTTVSTSTKYTIVDCSSQGLINCPVYLQRTTSVKSTMTTVLTVESGIDATYPASTFSSLTSAIPFGSNARRLGSTSGTPVSYVPPTATATSSAHPNTDDDHNHNNSHSNNHKLIIGLSVGLGFPAVVALAAALW
ncbi:hypothetical protein AtubIFM55763_011702 [Aspergillus tubingensis]|uniref:transketolase, thiamine diphosphate binding domain family protein n=1 Tax=Aspergillus tubingensis TaxID=5068 RepID=UPI0015783329|nr:transketolase, thiamine diphosphate binding domain family protein [Aspergillus tubingensis]GFN13543.1 transketolase, thiamine diphosphate binding domain family protein [Aspergillus tubingensis]GLA78688.1 hypothetical protein AtubIFM55763_011702 [Aspergillus tubingensis]